MINKKNILENIFLPLGDALSGQNVMKHFRFYHSAQKWPESELQNYQALKLQKLLRVAVSETEFYNKLYADIPFERYKELDLSILENLPIVTKDMLKSAYPQACTIPTKRPYVELYTSGSSGEPFCARLDEQTLSESRALMLLRANFSGWEIGEKYLQTGMTLKRGIVKKVKDLLLGAHYVSAFNLSDQQLDSYLRVIEENKLEYLMGYAASIYCLANRARETNISRKMKGIVSWGDNLYPHYRRNIEETFHCKVTDTYGCGEGIQVASQCHLGKYHIFTPHVIVEFVDSKGRHVREGEIGDILLTRLTPGAMPFIRYRVGDIGIPGGRCSCGCNFKVMKSIEGRDSDIVYTSNGNKLIVHFFTGIFEYETSIKEFQIIQEEIGEIGVRIVPSDGFDDSVMKKLEYEILEKSGGGLKINFFIVEKIHVEKSNKRRFVISKVRG